MPSTTAQSGAGRYGKAIRQTSLRERYLEQMNAPDWLSLRDETSLVGAKINGLLEKIDTNGIDFDALMALYQSLHSRITQEDLMGAQMVSDEMGRVLEKGVAESIIWKDLYQAIEQRRKLVETEMKTLNTMGAMLSMEQVMGLIGKLMAALTLHVEDKGKLAAIHGEFNKVLDLTPRVLEDKK